MRPPSGLKRLLAAARLHSLHVRDLGEDGKDQLPYPRPMAPSPWTFAAES